MSSRCDDKDKTAFCSGIIPCFPRKLIMTSSWLFTVVVIVYIISGWINVVGFPFHDKLKSLFDKNSHVQHTTTQSGCEIISSNVFFGRNPFPGIWSKLEGTHHRWVRHLDDDDDDDADVPMIDWSVPIRHVSHSNYLAITSH